MKTEPDRPRASTRSIERRLDRERRIRAQAEQIAEDATRRLYRQQLKLSAVLDVATTANETDNITDSSQQCLKALAAHTNWKHSHAFFHMPNDELCVVARLNMAIITDSKPPDQLVSTHTHGSLQTATEVRTEFLEEPITTDQGDTLFCCICSICAGGRVYGVIEAFSPRPDTDRSFTHDLLEGLAKQLGYVYRREWEGRATDHFAYHDPLTGIGNRLLFLDRLRHAMRRADREGQCIGLIAIDLDYLKDLNDSAGHSAGDDYLRAVSGCILEATRDADTAARLGGDEFALILEGFHGPAADSDVVRRLMTALSRPVTIGDRTITPSVSIGLAVYPDDADDMETLLQCADQAMYRAKGAGGAQILVYNADL